MTEVSGKTYEMLWDCEYCGAKKLLGLTHRHCPECGAAQDPKRRYFPPDEEKIAVEDHAYVGADVHCPACNAPMSAKVKFCAACGAPLQGGAEVARVVEKAAPAAAVPRAKTVAPRKGPGLKIALFGGIGALVLALILALVFWKKEVAITAVRHTWQREIKIEVFGPVNDAAWCDQMPSGAYEIARAQEVRSYNEIPDGQDCRTAKKDNGDGTFTEVQECTAKTRKEPVYADKCRFKIDRWSVGRSAVASGEGLAQAPAWPAVALVKTGQGLGAEREGARAETYTVHFSDGTSAAVADTCGLPEAQWRGIADGSKWKADKSVITGLLDCASLEPLR
jgi:hypothetical protein